MSEREVDLRTRGYRTEPGVDEYVDVVERARRRAAGAPGDPGRDERTVQTLEVLYDSLVQLRQMLEHDKLRSHFTGALITAKTRDEAERLAELILNRIHELEGE